MEGGLESLDGPVPSELAHLPGVEVGHARVPDLALAHEFAEGATGFFEWSLGVGPVQLVEIDVVGAEVAQARLHALPQPGRARIPDEGVSLHAQPALVATITSSRRTRSHSASPSSRSDTPKP